MSAGCCPKRIRCRDCDTDGITVDIKNTINPARVMPLPNEKLFKLDCVKNHIGGIWPFTV